jgi:hypothetical protein
LIVSREPTRRKNFLDRRGDPFADAGNFTKPVFARQCRDMLRISPERLGGASVRAGAERALAGDLEEATMPIEQIRDRSV